MHNSHDYERSKLADELAEPLELIVKLSRRRFVERGVQALGGLGLGAMAGLLGSGQAAADKAVKTGQFIFPRLRFDVNDETVDRWNVHPVGDVNLRRKLEELTNINVSQDPAVVTLGDFDDMCRHPFVFMTSEGYFTLTEQEEHNMREFLERGGFILADDCVWIGKGDRFFRTYNKLMDKLFPDHPMRKIPYDHELFHLYYDFDKGAPHCQGVPHGAYGLFEPGTGRLMTVNIPGDIHCGWCCQFFPADKNIASIKMGINIVLYFLSH